MHELLTNDEMRRADDFAIASGIASTELMERAGRAVADAIISRYPSGRVVVLAGPGNNGGDGYVAARHLAEQGRDVVLWQLAPPSTADAQWAASLWQGPTGTEAPDSAGVVVDALIGAGINRPLSAEMVSALRAFGPTPIVAVDVPSGVNGSTSQVDSGTPYADITVTFCRPKLGHTLFPSRAHVGELVVADIGISDTMIDELAVQAHVNHPDLWRSALPVIGEQDHKYTKGHAVVRSGPFHSTGAARLAAMAALRSGAGLVSVAGDEAAVRVNAEHLTTVMNKIVDTPAEWDQLIGDRRVTAVLTGPGNGVDPDTKEATLRSLAMAKPTVIDADALTVFADDPEALFASPGIKVLTPHDGEFDRLFPLDGSRVEKARMAARLSNSVVVAKGPDTTIADPTGRAVVSTNGSRWLSSAGTGDVLAGMIAGLIASGMPPFPAACAAVWMHAEAADLLGRGLIAEDLPGALPAVWQLLS